MGLHGQSLNSSPPVVLHRVVGRDEELSHGSGERGINCLGGECHTLPQELWRLDASGFLNNDHQPRQSIQPQ
jgi:hypothetical protein